MAKLRTTVHVDGKSYGPGDVPADVVGRISNPNVWDGDVPAGAGSNVEALPMSPVLSGGSLQPGKPERVVTADGPPPKGGPGSGRDAWAAYAGQHDVDVPADATREDIVAALEAADVPTE